MLGKLWGSGENKLRAGKTEQNLGTSSHQKCCKRQAQGNPMLKDGAWLPNSCTYANTYNIDRENLHLFLLRNKKGFLFGRSVCSEPPATQVLYSNSRKDAWETTGDKHVLYSLLLYSSKATYPLYNHKNSDREPRPFYFLPSCPVTREVWTWIRCSVFHVCCYWSALCNVKEPQEKRMEELHTSWHLDLFLGSCLGLEPWLPYCQNIWLTW